MKTSASGAAVKAEPEITRRDVHTASSINAQRRLSKPAAKEANLARQAAIRRSSTNGKQIGNQNPQYSKPVLVRASPSKADMKKKPKPTVDTGSPALPSLESFSIHDILASIGPEADASIDAIAEICGRSRMSLAEEHASHRPPHVQLLTAGNSPAESIPSMRLQPVAEAAPRGPHTRSKSRCLALASASRSGEVVSSEATAATSNVTSHAQASNVSPKRKGSSSQSLPAPLLSQIFAWLRRSEVGNETSSIQDRDPRAAQILQNMLSDSNSIRP